MQQLRSARPDTAQHVPQREMTAALSADELVLHFQPIVVLDTGRIRGVEALLRWNRSDGIVLMPDDFLPAVADTPVMRRITAWVIDRACAQAVGWEPWTMSVNIAAVDVVQPALVDTVDASLRRHKLPPERLILELTEHAAVQGLAAATDVLQRLRDRGVGVALDDFGTGYSSLLYLRDLPVTEVKIDRTFVRGVEQQEDDAAIVRSVVMLAHNVGLGVVAEGVETPGQARYLQGIGCTCAQGYRVPNDRSKTGRPQTPEDVMARMSALVTDGASLHTIAAALNREGLLTARQRRWTAPAVARALRDSPMSHTSGDGLSRDRYNRGHGEWTGTASERQPSAS
jgi:EAL domain-containing protein (putative c-di-GMP-specific phosphodiesterase class I)